MSRLAGRSAVAAAAAAAATAAKPTKATAAAVFPPYLVEGVLTPPINVGLHFERLKTTSTSRPPLVLYSELSMYYAQILTCNYYVQILAHLMCRF